MRFDIRLVLRNVLLTSLGTGAAACGGSTTAGEPGDPQPNTPVDPNDFVEPGCHPMFGVDKVGAVQASGGFDYVELHERAADDLGGERMLVQSSGVKCAMATDVAACEQAIADAATSYSGFYMGYCTGGLCSRYHYVVNQGDAVQTITHFDDVLALVSPIDTAPEATLRVLLEGYDVACSDLEHGGVRAVDDGFEVIATTGGDGCTELDSTRYVLAVTAAGTVTELESEMYSSGQPYCAG